jgi:hypothetical protein
MQIAVSIRWAVVIDDDVDTLYIDTTAKDICRNKNTLLKSLEGCVSIDAV